VLLKKNVNLTLRGISYLLCKILTITFLLLMTACSNVRFQSMGYATVTTEVDLKDTEKVEVKGEVIFYLWGNYPKEHIVNIDDEFKKRGFSYISDPRIEEYQTFLNYFLTAVTFGMYNPRNYRITAFVIKESNRYDF